jgi:hypothetical protein
LGEFGLFAFEERDIETFDEDRVVFVASLFERIATREWEVSPENRERTRASWLSMSRTRYFI